MTEKPYTKIGNTYYPRYIAHGASNNEIKGSGWRAWKDGENYYYEYDAGHFATNMTTVLISEDDFNSLRDRKIAEFDIKKYC